MLKKIRANMLMLIDIVIINLSLICSYLLRFEGNASNITARYLENMIYIAAATTVLKLCCFWAFKLYQSLWKYAGAYEGMYVVLAAFVSNAIMTAYSFITLSVPRSIFIICFFIDVFFIGGVRFAYRMFRRLIKGEFLRFGEHKRVLIIGAGEAGSVLVNEYKMHPELRNVPVAIIDDDDMKIGKKLNGVPVVGKRNDIQKVVDKYEIDEIVIAIPSLKIKEINEIYNECAKTQCKVKVLPSVSQMVDGAPLVNKVKDVDIEDLLGREPVKLDCEEIASCIEGKTVLVTGGGGSIGSELCRQIANFNPRQLIILDNYENNAYDIQNELLFNYPKLNLKVVIANIRERRRMEEIFSSFRPDIVFHAAAHKHVPLMEENPTEAISNNIFGTLNVAECADKYETKKFVLISTDKAVNPTNIMGATKRVAEMIIQALDRHSKTEFVAVRFGNVLGSNGSVIPLFKKQIERGGPVTVTHPEVTRFFMTIQEAAQLVIQAGAMAKGGEIFVLDMGEPVKIYDLARNLIKLSGFEPDKDIMIKFTGLRPGEKLYEELLMSEEGLKATKHKKIFIAPPTFTDFAMIKREIEHLKEIITGNSEDIIDQIKLMVPTYKKAL